MSEQHDVVVIGAGQAGLATSYHLRAAGADFVVLDAGRRVGDGWRRFWDSLHLFSPARFNNLPGIPFPGDPDHRPHKDELAGYLESYATQLDLPVRLGVRVTRLRRTDGCFEVETDGGPLRAKAIVVATGSLVSPVVPDFAADLDPRIVQLTATSYQNPAQLPPGEALVVGAGNSGVQISMELAATRPTWLAGPNPGCLPRRFLHRDIFSWIDHFGVMRWRSDSALGRALIAQRRGKGDPVVGVRERDIEAAGVRRAPRVVGVADGRPVLADGRVVEARSVVWCCGLRPDFSWVEGLEVDAHGSPRHCRGHSEGIEGLFFMGLRFQARIGSDTVGGVALDAADIASAVMAHVSRGSSRSAA